jgi:hypothetical protein
VRQRLLYLEYRSDWFAHDEGAKSVVSVLFEQSVMSETRIDIGFKRATDVYRAGLAQIAGERMDTGSNVDKSLPMPSGWKFSGGRESQNLR